MKLRHDAYCGLNCGACPVGMANESGDEGALLKMAADWGVAREEVTCAGCKTDETAKFCSSCTMRDCARERELEFCGECPEYPCETITGFRNDSAPHHSVVFSNLKKIREQGMEAWLAQQGERWSCPKCGTRFSWYTDTCSGCGAELYDAVREEEDLEI